jgi:hypothetical protein
MQMREAKARGGRTAWGSSRRRRRGRACGSGGDDDVPWLYFGLIPLVVAAGAVQIGRGWLGTPVFCGMIAASFLGIFIIPLLYAMFQSLRERVARAPR